MVNFIRDHFYTEEPLSKSLNYHWDSETSDWLVGILKQSLSFAIVAETGDIIAAQIIGLENKSDRLQRKQFRSEDLRKTTEALGCLSNLCNVYEHYDVEDVVHFWQLGVHSDHRRRGFAIVLHMALLTVFKSFEGGHLALYVECTHNGSKRVFEKLGFDALSEIMFAEYKDEGRLAFTNTGEHKSEILYGKKI